MSDSVDLTTRLTGRRRGGGLRAQATFPSRHKTDSGQYCAARVPHTRHVRRSSQANTEDLERDMRSP